MMCILITLAGIGLLFGGVYPALAIAAYRLSGSKKTVREILREI